MSKIICSKGCTAKEIGGIGIEKYSTSIRKFINSKNNCHTHFNRCVC